jgi:ABC-2 type transport system ATP-binding protein
MINSKIVLNVDSVSKTFSGNETPALQKITFNVFSGKMTGVVGPDGSGKTTLLRLLASLMQPDQGNITVDGFNSVKNAEQIHQIIGYMPQKFGLYEDLTVSENLNLYADLRNIHGKERQEKMVRLLSFTQLADFKTRLSGKLSGGMKQKLGLACALIGDPNLLILDEPSVGVDPISRRELWAMVQELLVNNIAVVWSTSYLDEASKCDSVILLDEGKSLFNGEPQKLLEIVDGCSYLITQLPAEKKRGFLSEISKINYVIDNTIQGDNVRIVIADAKDENSVSRDLKKLGMDCQRTPPRFEDAYIKLLGGFINQTSALANVLPSKPSEKLIVIEAKNLTKRYGQFTAVNHLNFTVERGEVFGLLGPNGAGKSTTFKMLCGLLTPTEGTASVMGLDLQSSSSLARNRIGYMAQKFSLYNNLNGLQNLTFFSGVYGLTAHKQKKQIDMMIDVFNLQDYLTAKTGELPLGIKQRFALACSLMHEPDILFLDEPTSGVDPITRREFWMHINGMVEKGITVMVTTHFMEEAEYCDRIALIYRGNNIATGSPDHLKNLCKSEKNPHPSLEDAFIELVTKHDKQGVTL